MKQTSITPEMTTRGSKERGNVPEDRQPNATTAHKIVTKTAQKRGRSPLMVHGDRPGDPPTRNTDRRPPG